VAAARTASRAALGEDPSDADEDVARRMAERFDTWPAAAMIDTDCSLADTASLVAAAIGGPS
jgi:uncharacterized protein